MSFSSIFDVLPASDGARIRRWMAFLTICALCGACGRAIAGTTSPAQTELPASKTHRRSEKASPHGPAASRGSASGRASVRPSENAKVSLKDGKLTVMAKNSDLVAVLRQVASLSGMHISGLGKSTRIFGEYGPGAPQKVLTQLLTGSGYNFMMVGRTLSGTPRTLLLMVRSNAPEPRAGNAPTSNPTPKPVARKPVEPHPAQATRPSPALPPRRHLGPGAIAHVPPSEALRHEDRQTRMQQNLQRLRQMRQEMQQQQQQGKPQE